MIKQKENGLNNLIVEEKLKPEETYRFVNNAIKDGTIKFIGLILKSTLGLYNYLADTS